jgi:uncharacterized lipoprotein
LNWNWSRPERQKRPKPDSVILMKICFTRLSPLLLVVFAILALAACSSENKKPEYYDAVETAALEIPEGLSRPDPSSALVIQSPYVPLPSTVLQDMPPRITSTTSGLKSNSRLNWSAEGLYLLVKDTPESTHRRVGIVLERGGMQRIRVDEKGVYRFDYFQVFEEEHGFFRKMAFWSEDETEDYSGAYQVYTEADGENTRVYIKYADGTDCEPDAAEHLLDVLSERMG